jgi:hypothetical protein
MNPLNCPVHSFAYEYGPPTLGTKAEQYENDKAIVSAINPAIIQTKREIGPTKLAPRETAMYISAPMVEPITKLVTSKVFNCLLKPISGFKFSH